MEEDTSSFRRTATSGRSDKSPSSEDGLPVEEVTLATISANPQDENESFSTYCERVAAWLMTAPNPRRQNLSSASTGEEHDEVTLSRGSGGCRPNVSFEEENEEGQKVAEQANAKRTQRRRTPEHRYTQLLAMLMSYRREFPGSKVALRFSDHDRIPFETRSIYTIVGWTSGEHFGRLICPCCAIFHTRETKPLSRCPRRYCEKQLCVLFDQERVPYPFQRTCGCPAHDKIWGRVMAELRPELDKEPWKYTPGKRRILEERAKAQAEQQKMQKRLNIEGPPSPFQQDYGGYEMNDIDACPPHNGDDVDIAGMHTSAEDVRPEKFYAFQLRKLKGYRVVKKGLVYALQEPFYRGGKLHALKEDKFCHVVLINTALPGGPRSEGNLDSNNIGSGYSKATMWICDCRRNGLSRLLYEEASRTGATFNDVEEMFSELCGRPGEEQGGFEPCIHSLAAKLLFGERYTGEGANWPREGASLNTGRVSLPPRVQALGTTAMLFSVSGVSEAGGGEGEEVMSRRLLWDRSIVQQTSDSLYRCFTCMPQNVLCRHCRALSDYNDGSQVSSDPLNAPRRESDRQDAATNPPSSKTTQNGTPASSFRQVGCRRIAWRSQETIDLISKRDRTGFPKGDRDKVPSSEILHDCSCSTTSSNETRCTCGSKCWKCGAEWRSLVNVDYVECTFWGSAGKCQILVPRLQCSRCITFLEWDGHGSGIFRFSSDTAVAYDVCITSLTLAAKGTPFSVQHESLCQNYKLHKHVFSLSRHTFNKVLWSFMEALTDNWTELSACPHCKNLTHCVEIVVDGTAVAPRREFIKPEHNRKRPLVPQDELRTFKGSSSKTRMFIKDKGVRDTLRQFAASSSVTSLEDTLIDAACDKTPYMRPLIAILRVRGQEGYSYAKESADAARRLLRALTATTSAYQGLIKNPVAVKKSLEVMAETGKLMPSDKLTIKSYFPTFWDFIAEHLSTKVSFWEEMHPLVERLVQACTLVVHDDEKDDQRPWHPVALDDDLSRGIWLPTLGKERHFHNYSAHTRDWELYDCNKDYKGKHSTLLPGIFTFNCPHGLYLGFTLMMRPESPETMFSILYSRFPDAKRVIIYDNACKLLEYCMNREPFYFKDTMFLIDRLHAKTHVGCTPGHIIDSFWWAQSVNSQASEQGNARTTKLKTQSSFMTVYHFTLFMRFTTCYLNEEKKERLLKTLSKKRDQELLDKTEELHKNIAMLRKLYGTDNTFPDKCNCVICEALMLPVNK